MARLLGIPRGITYRSSCRWAGSPGRWPHPEPGSTRRSEMPCTRRRWVHRSEEHTSELQSPCNLVCRLLLEKKKKKKRHIKEYEETNIAPINSSKVYECLLSFS